MREVIGIFRHEAVEKLFQIALRRRVGIFHHHDAAASVLNKDRDCSVSQAGLVDLRLHFIGDFVETFAVAAHFDSVVMYVYAGHLVSIISNELEIPLIKRGCDEIKHWRVQEGIVRSIKWMKVRVQFYAQLRDLVGVRELELELTEAATVRELLQQLYAPYPALRAHDKSILVGAGLEFVDRNYKLNSGEEIAIMPPVQGG